MSVQMRGRENTVYRNILCNELLALTGQVVSVVFA